MATMELQTETKPEEKQQVVAEGPEPLVYTTWVLKVSIHCQGCKRKIKKILTNIDGVYTTNIDLKQQKVVVTGNVEAETLIRKIVKAGRHAELWAESPDKKPKKTKKKEKDSGDEEESSEEEDDGNNNNNGLLIQENSNSNSKPEIKQVVSFSTAGQPQPTADNGGAKKKKKKKRKKKNNTTTTVGGNEGSAQQPNNVPATMIQAFSADHGPPQPYMAEYGNPPYQNCGYPPPQSHYHSPAAAATYTVSRSNAYPREVVGAYSSVSYYAPPSYYSYGYGYPAVSGGESPPSDYDPDADQASDSFDEMFSDGNAGACFVM